MNENNAFLHSLESKISKIPLGKKSDNDDKDYKQKISEVWLGYGKNKKEKGYVQNPVPDNQTDN